MLKSVLIIITRSRAYILSFLITLGQSWMFDTTTTSNMYVVQWILQYFLEIRKRTFSYTAFERVSVVLFRCILLYLICCVSIQDWFYGMMSTEDRYDSTVQCSRLRRVNMKRVLHVYCIDSQLLKLNPLEMTDCMQSSPILWATKKHFFNVQDMLVCSNHQSLTNVLSDAIGLIRNKIFRVDQQSFQAWSCYKNLS